MTIRYWINGPSKATFALMALALLSAAGKPRLNADAKDGLPPEHPMTFILDETLCGGSMGDCGVIAEGSIDRGAAKRFREFVAAHKLASGQVRFNSGGSDLDSGYLLGRAIRELGFDTAIADKSTPINQADRCPRLAQPTRGLVKDGHGKIEMSREYFAILTCGIGPQVFLVKHGKCLSSCAFAYLGGVVRSFPESEMFTWSDDPAQFIRIPPIGSMDAANQQYIGFHPFTPNALIDLPARAREEQISAWAQRQSPAMLEYLSDMGYPQPEQFIEFMNKGKVGSSITANRFHFPTANELMSAGVLAHGNFLPLRLVPESDGLALISSFSNGLLWEKQISFFCARAEAQPPKLAMMLTGGRDQARHNGPSPRVTFEGIGEPPPKPEIGRETGLLDSDPFGVFSYQRFQRHSWKIAIKADGRPLFEGGQFESHPPPEMGPDGKPLPISLDSRHIIFDVNDGNHYTSANSVIPMDRNLQHFVVYLNSIQLSDLKRSRHILIDYGMGSVRKADINIDLDFSANLNILMHNCISLKPPIDKIDGYNEGLKV